MTHQENYGPGFAADPRARLVGVADEAGVAPRRAELNRRLAEQLGIPLFPDLDSVLRRDDVQIVSVCSEFERRARVAARCAEAGKHVYVDKPLATTVDGARSLVDAVRRAGVYSQMFTQIGAPYAQRLKRAIGSGVLGEVRSVHCDQMFAKGDPGSAPLDHPRREHFPPKGFTFPDAKREIWTVAVYSLTLIRWLLGGPAFRSVCAHTANYFFREHYEHDVEDYGMLSLTLEGGVTATISAGRIGWRSHRSFGPNFTRLVGSRRTVTVSAHQPRFEIASDQDDWSAPARDPDDPMGFWQSTQDRSGVRSKEAWFAPQPVPGISDQSLFLDAVEQEREAEVTAADGAAAVEVLLAAYRSAATGEKIDLQASIC
jgi:predicted dehydrogenase